MQQLALPYQQIVVQACKASDVQAVRVAAGVLFLLHHTNKASALAAKPSKAAGESWRTSLYKNVISDPVGFCSDGVSRKSMCANRMLCAHAGSVFSCSSCGKWVTNKVAQPATTDSKMFRDWLPQLSPNPIAKQ